MALRLTHSLYKLTNFLRVFFARSGFNTRRDIDAPGMQQMNGLRNVFISQPAGNDYFHRPLHGFDQGSSPVPVECLSRPAWLLGRARVQEDSMKREIGPISRSRLEGRDQISPAIFRL